MVIREVNNCLSMPDVASYLGFHPNSKGFIKSPFHDEKTASCKLYKELGRGYYDFSAGEGGDCVRFVARTQGLNSWEACKLLIEAFNLPVDAGNTHLTRQRVQELERQREQNRRRKDVTKRKWTMEIDSLKSTIRICEELLKNPRIEPLSDIWCMAVNQRNKTIIRANELVGLETTKKDLELLNHSYNCYERHERQVS